MKITAKNFFCEFINNPFSKKLSGGQKAGAFFASVILGIFTLGIPHLVCYAKSLKNRKVTKSPNDPTTKKTNNTVRPSDPTTKKINDTAPLKPFQLTLDQLKKAKFNCGDFYQENVDQKVDQETGLFMTSAGCCC